MNNRPEDILSSIFGFPHFRPGQREIVDHLLHGTDTLTVMPTGAGKSLCYQVPALIFEAVTVVISPLVALMDDQVAGLRANGVEAACIHSGKSRDQNVQEWLKVRRGEAKLLYLSPERLMTDRMLTALKQLTVAMFVVDEAHCISKWGASFRPEYEMLSTLPQQFPETVMAAFTATADAATRDDIARKLFRGNVRNDGKIIVHGFDRANLNLTVLPKGNWKRQVMAFLEDRKGQSGILYCLSRRLTEDVANWLSEEGFHALAYHAGLTADVRKEHQDIFMTEPAVVMVATIAFGMGIDKPDIRFVFHLNLASSMEAYYQEIGRAGRDGLPSDVCMLYGLDDIRLRRQFIDQDGEDEDHRRREHKRLDAFLAFCEAVTCRRAALLNYFGETTEPCGNCDTCRTPPTVIDGSHQARMLFSAIVKTGQNFGTAHIIDILRGIKTPKAEEHGHDRLDMFGIGLAHSKTFWQSFIRQAVAGGFIHIDIQGYGGLVMSGPGEAVLKGETVFEYREIPTQNTRGRSGKRHRQSRGISPEEMGDIDTELLSALKNLRRDLASGRGVPAYVIFSDATLMDMCRLQPETLDQMKLVSGVGPKKLADFGMIFLKALGKQRGL